MYKFILVILIGYLMGCLQWSYIFSKTFKKSDIRNLGVGNAGASNTLIVFGWKMGVAVAVLDIIKAIISILIIKHLIELNFLDNKIIYLYLNGAAVIVGHNYPFFMDFKGGKGTASTLGMLFGIDYRLGIIGFLIILIVSIISDYITFGTIALVSFFVLSTIYLDYGIGCILIAFFIAFQSIYKHIPNLKKIKSTEENRVKSVLKKKSKNI